MSGPTCSCGRPVKDQAYICAGCTDRLSRALGDVPALFAEVETTRLRQSRTGGRPIGSVSRTADKPLPWDQRASEALSELRTALVRQVLHVTEERGTSLGVSAYAFGPACAYCSQQAYIREKHPSCVLVINGAKLAQGPADTLEAMSQWLLGQMEWIRHQPDAAEAVREIGQTVHRIGVVIDSAQERVYAGPCQSEQSAEGDLGERCCLGEMYANKGASAVTCPNCRYSHDFATRRRWLLEQVEDQLVNAAWMASALTSLDTPVTAERIRKWAERGRIEAKGVDIHGRPTYRVGDCLDLLADDAAREERKRHGRVA